MRNEQVERKWIKKKWSGIKNRIELISLFSLYRMKLKEYHNRFKNDRLPDF